MRFVKLAGVAKFGAVCQKTATTIQSARMTGQLPRLPALKLSLKRCHSDSSSRVSTSLAAATAIYTLPAYVWAMPETFVGSPAVIACTISCCVHLTRS